VQFITKTELWRDAIISPSLTIEQAIGVLDKCGLKILLAIDDGGRFIGTVSDGDIRRAILSKLTLVTPIDAVINRGSITVSKNTTKNVIAQLIKDKQVQHVPIVDDGFLSGLYQFNINGFAIQNLVVIMAGGLGSRMAPITNSCPKPMIELDGKPILQHTIERVKKHGFYKFSISVNYLGHMIEDHFGDGSSFGVEISYLRETSPLGTAGSLSLLNLHLTESVLVMNGDVLSDVNYLDLLTYHDQLGCLATMAVYSREYKNKFGVVDTDGWRITSISEKLVVKSLINAGVYVLAPGAITSIPQNTKIDMTDFLNNLILSHENIAAYPIHEDWIDLGSPEDLAKAREVM